ncbi:MAG: ribonuclease P protein component [Chitinophagaceae bacterium]|nr:ribonuclease P protein component [Chitinophagaceae bacterium]
MTKQGLPKAERLKSRESLEQLFASGKSFSVFPIKVFYQLVEVTTPNIEMAVGVSSRNFKKAVDRNRIKRLLRESYRTQKELISIPEGKKINIFFLYLAKELPEFTTLKKQMQEILQKINERVHK